MIYDARRNGGDPRARRFPCPVTIIDSSTGERIPNVFWLDTEGELRRFLSSSFDAPLYSPDGKTRLEVHERRPWKAVKTEKGLNEVILESSRPSNAGIIEGPTETALNEKFERWSGTDWEPCEANDRYTVGAVWRTLGGVRVYQTEEGKLYDEATRYFTYKNIDSPDGTTIAEQMAEGERQYRSYMARGQEGVLIL